MDDHPWFNDNPSYSAELSIHTAPYPIISPNTSPVILAQNKKNHRKHTVNNDLEAILVRDPPGECLFATPLVLSRPSACVGNFYHEPREDLPQPSGLRSISLHEQQEYPTEVPLTSVEPLHSTAEMTKRRRSLQSIFIPSFFHVPLTATSPTSPSSPTSYYSCRPPNLPEEPSTSPSADDIQPMLLTQQTLSAPSPRSSPPPDFLLDDDPFANLTASPSESLQQFKAPTSPKLSHKRHSKPRSPLTTSQENIKLPVLPPSQVDPLTRKASARLQPRPAHQKPAFGPRPSLPSLDTLARMNVVLTKKVRKGRVGASLPFEPWDNMENGEASVELSPQDALPISPTNTLQSTILDTQNSVVDHDIHISLKHSTDGNLETIPNSSVIHSELETRNHTGDHNDGIVNTHPEGENLETELAYTTDTDTSIADLSLPTLSRTTSVELTSGTLSRSLSSASYSSSGSSANGEPVGYYPSSIYSHFFSSSAGSDSDILSSPPDQFVSFSAHFNAGMVSDWRDNQTMGPTELFEPRSSVGVDERLSGETGMMPGTSAGTIRSSLITHMEVDKQGEKADVVDGSGWGERRGDSQLASNTSKSYNHSGGSSMGNGGNSSGGGVLGGHRGNGRDDDEDDRGDKRRNIKAAVFFSPSSSEANSSDEESADDYGQPSAIPPKTGFRAASRNPASSDDDDVPLAQRIPTALTAQRSIRRQVRQERDQRRKDREAKADVRTRQTTLRPTGTAAPLPVAAVSSSTEGPNNTAPLQRQRTRTLPGNSPQPFMPEDLVRKLKTMQTTDSSADHSRTLFRIKSTKEVSPEVKIDTRIHQDSSLRRYASPPLTSPAVEPAQMLRPMRSFHRVERSRQIENQPPLPNSEQPLGRSITRARSRTREESQEYQARPYVPPVPVPAPYAEEPPTQQSRKSEEHRKLLKSLGDRPSTSPTDADRSQRPSLGRPLVADSTKNGPIIQQRIFIRDMQCFNMVEIGPSTTAADVIELVNAQGSLAGWAGSGGWMVWEVAQDFGMERPIRSYELLADVQASWNKDKTVNAFMLKLTPLAVPLSRSAIPTSSPTFSGYVEWEYKRGKWSKRWMQLREHGLWLSKRDNGKDQVLLCSLSNFDAYHFIRPRRSPKPYIFAVKSTDKLSFFEDTADYLHVFSCQEKDGHAWMEKILVARSYVLYQEKHVLFNPKASNGNSAASQSQLSRSGTKKLSVTHRPLVSVPVPHPAAPLSKDIFEPGSLLRRKL